MAGTLYLVASPIGNLGDVTYRAVETLKQVDVIASEDTRRTRILLTHYGVEKLLLSYHDHSAPGKREALLKRLESGEHVALISDAGTPLVNDPGFKLVRDCHERGITVTALPGPCAVINALVLSGLAPDVFTYIGYLPAKGGKRRKQLLLFQDRAETLIFLESPYRVLDALADVAEVFKDPRVAVCREMTKKFEEVFRGKATEARNHFASAPVKGEFTVVVGKD